MAGQQDRQMPISSRKASGQARGPQTDKHPSILRTRNQASTKDRRVKADSRVHSPPSSLIRIRPTPSPPLSYRTGSPSTRSVCVSGGPSILHSFFRAATGLVSCSPWVLVCGCCLCLGPSLCPLVLRWWVVVVSLTVVLVHIRS